MKAGRREVVPTRSALRELTDERRVVAEGHELLDQKRMLLAAEILRRLERFEEARRGFEALHRDASRALAAAVGRHGVEGLLCYPAAPVEGSRLETEGDAYMGVPVLEASLELPAAAPPRPPAAPSPEARRCAEAFRRALERTAELAALAASLERLGAEYRRTERRARALEDVLMPELDEAIGRVGEQLEELDREEAVRARLHRRGD